MIGPGRWWIVGLLYTTAVGIALAAVGGHLFGVMDLASWRTPPTGGDVPMALPTAAALICLGCGALLEHSRRR